MNFELRGEISKFLKKKFHENPSFGIKILQKVR